MGKVLVIDTSILCVWLGVPDKETCGPEHDKWTQKRVADKIRSETGHDVTFVLPLASIIETGNHIAHSSLLRYELANRLGEMMRMSADTKSPWASFSDQNTLWQPEKIRKLANTWPELASRGFSLGDATIKDVADYYSVSGFAVEILTGDQELKAYEPLKPVLVPRRRQRR